MKKMLATVIGENNRLTLKLHDGPGYIFIDPGQFDQIVMNLVVNAKDALKESGNILIETGFVNLDEQYARSHHPIVPGDFLVITFSDTGHGMDAATLSRVFEPFFTTKDKGKGTGLGLATVYGIVKQNNGFIYADSDVGAGTTFKIYFPPVPREILSEEAKEDGKEHIVQWEKSAARTILICEDEAPLLEVVRNYLEAAGYNVFSTTDPKAVDEFVATFKGKIDLLVTDMVMPDISGKELYKSVSRKIPGLKAVFMSGYTEDVFAETGKIGEDIYFLEKPFRLTKLREIVEKALSDN